MSASAQQKSAEPSMEEILASIRRIISDDQPAAPEPPAPAMPVAMFAPAVQVPAMQAPAPIMPAPAMQDEDEDVLDLTAPIQAKAATAMPEPMPVAPAMVAPAPSMTEIPHMVGDHLISGTTDTMVANAFGSLAHTVLTQNARTIDDVVKEMLRPMLKAWLDDNLPMIVERLVRSEIERVARGAR